MSHICNYCNKSFSSQYTLAFHQKTAKYCIAIQSRNNNVTISDKYACEFCEKIVTTKSNLLTHLLSCKVKQEHDKLEKESIKLDQQRIQYEKELDNQIEYSKLQHEKEVDLLKQEVRMLREQLTEKNTEIVSLRDKLTTPQHVTINDNSTNNNN